MMFLPKKRIVIDFLFGLKKKERKKKPGQNKYCYTAPWFRIVFIHIVYTYMCVIRQGPNVYTRSHYVFELPFKQNPIDTFRNNNVAYC